MLVLCRAITNSFYKHLRVMRWILVGLVAATIVSQTAWPRDPVNQTRTNPSTIRTVTTVGTVSGDEKFFVDGEDNKNWKVTNPDVRKGHGGNSSRLGVRLMRKKAKFESYR